MKMCSDVQNRVGTHQIKMCSDVYTKVGTPHMKMCSDAQNRVGTPQKFKSSFLRGGWVGGWPGGPDAFYSPLWL